MNILDKLKINHRPSAGALGERDVELVVLASEDTTDQRITKFLHNYAYQYV